MIMTEDPLSIDPDNSLAFLPVDELRMRALEQLEAFRQISAAVGSQTDIYDILSLIGDKTRQLMRAERTFVFFVEYDEKHHPYLKSVLAEGCATLIVQFGQGIAGNAAKKRQRINIKDAYQSTDFDPSFDQKTGFHTRSCLAAPIFSFSGELVGVIQVINKCHGGYFTHFDEDMLDSVCAQIGISITQHRHYIDMLHKNAELRAAQETLKRRNAELDMLYAMERKAASAPHLEGLMRLMLDSCIQAFHLPVAHAIVTTNASHRLFAVDTRDSQKQNLHTECLVRLPTLLSAAIKRGECSLFSAQTIQTLAEQCQTTLGYAFHALLVAPFVQENQTFGALILGSTQPQTPFFSTAEGKLASIFAAHIAPSVRAHIEREADEKRRRLTAIGQMVASLLHDMKTPLANISGYVDLIVRQDEKAKREQLAAVVARQIDTLTHMSTEVLQYTRGQSAVILLPTDLHTILSETLSLLRPEAEKRHIDLICREQFRGKMPCDADKIQRLIVNLVRNALEAIDRSGSIWITTFQPNAEAVVLQIDDDGPGIPPQIGSTLFNAFVTHGKRNGTGLGLSIAKKIVDEHHATIEWHARIPRGTSFVLTFKAR